MSWAVENEFRAAASNKTNTVIEHFICGWLKLRCAVNVKTLTSFQRFKIDFGIKIYIHTYTHTHIHIHICI